MVQALAQEAAAVGITATEALRQIVVDYNARPWPFRPRSPNADKTAVWANIASDQPTIDKFTRHAKRHGVSVAEGIRQCVQKFLNEPGRRVQ